MTLRKCRIGNGANGVNPNLSSLKCNISEKSCLKVFPCQTFWLYLLYN